MTENEVVVLDFHKPYTENQDVTICTEVDPGPDRTVVVEPLNTPPAK